MADAGTCWWTTGIRDRGGLALGLVETSAVVCPIHAEHGGTGVAPGSCVVRRQHENDARTGRSGTGQGYGSRLVAA
ncbi:hypothetical protein [Streptomyces sp. NPDC101393]|uniref:hypothetical protein n=1 Tax=Streptomyces sp. NPDC101393 TaxID=3366141 RepID=UPI003809E550